MFTVSEYENDVSVKKVMAAGATLTVYSDSQYLGDGDSYYFTSATYLSEKGEVLVRQGVSNAVADASAEVALAVVDARAAAAALLSAKNVKKAADEAKKDALAVAKGRTVKITAKRAKNTGKEGRAFWIGESRWGTRVGFEVEGGEVVWTASKNLSVTGGNEDALALVAELENEAEIKAVAAASAAALAARVAKEALAETAFRLAVVASAA